MNARELAVGFALVIGSVGATVVGVRYTVQSVVTSVGAHPTRSIAGDSHALPQGRVLVGAKGAPTILVFNDYECPRCAELDRALDSLVRSGVDVSIRIRHRPLRSIHLRAFVAAVAAECAAEQGRFAEYHHALFRYSDLSDSILAGIARQVSIEDQSSFEQCLVSAKARQRVDTDDQDASALGISATPALIVRDSLYFGTRSVEQLRVLLKGSTTVRDHLRSLGRL